ncbi:hypothetical protein M1307_01695 [Patescibacteria group bacterium]|nr:hypothetical protein [Patescibacteria group bacterium]
MYPKFSSGRIFAPGNLGIALANGLVEKGHDVRFYSAPKTNTKAKLIAGDENLLKDELKYYLFRNRSEEEKQYSIAEIRKRDYEYALTLNTYKDAMDGKLDIIPFPNFCY